MTCELKQVRQNGNDNVVTLHDEVDVVTLLESSMAVDSHLLTRNDRNPLWVASWLTERCAKFPT